MGRLIILAFIIIQIFCCYREANSKPVDMNQEIADGQWMPTTTMFTPYMCNTHVNSHFKVSVPFLKSQYLSRIKRLVRARQDATEQRANDHILLLNLKARPRLFTRSCLSISWRHIVC
uniref:Uncharacterized protein n=1 Tax=Romanomermis culicivorax TaxID=13658 RepID=A0A915KKD8_ROMCU